MIPRIARQRLLTAALVLTAAGACVDGPFAHANPNDPDAEIVLSIAGGLDTLTSLESAVLFQLVTTPVTDAGSVSWASSAPSLLAPNGLGRFVVLFRPSQPTTVTVTARLGAHTAERNVVVLPLP